MKEILKFIFALIIFVPFSIVILITYCGMLLMREVMEFMGVWEE